MFTTASRRAWLGAWMVLAALILVLAPVASATEYLRYSRTASLEIDGNVHRYWNQRAGEQERLITYNGYQYSAYWDADDKLVISRRDVETNEVQGVGFSEYRLRNTEDPMLTPTLGISPNNGRLHIAFDNHISALKMLQSDANFITSPPGTIRASQFSRESFVLRALITTDAHFFNDNADDLYLTYYYGSSYREGTIQRMAYDSATSRWIGDETVIDGLTGCYRGPSVTRCRRGISTAGFRFDKNDRLHAAWTWIEELRRSPESEYEPLRLTHDLNYAYSDDYGATWYANDGRTRIADVNEEDPITVEDPTVVARVEEDYGILESKLVLDTHNRPHIVALQGATAGIIETEYNIHVNHYWRDRAGRWYSKFLTDESQWTGREKQLLGTAFLDDGDNFYYIHAVDRLGWRTPDDDASEITDFGWRTGGYVGGTKTETYAELTTEHIRWPSAGNTFEIRMRNDTEARTGQLYWIKDGDQTFDEEKSITIPLPGRSREYSTIRVELPNSWLRPELRPITRELVLEPVGLTARTRGEFSIDYIHILDVQWLATTVLKSWDFTEGWMLEAIESSPGDNYQTPTAHDLSTGATQAAFDQGFAVDLRYLQEYRYASIPSVEQNSENGLIAYSTREFMLGSPTVVKAWDFANEAEEWTNRIGITGFSATEGAAVGTVESLAELWTTEGLGVPIDQTTNRYITMRLRNATNATQASFPFLTNAEGSWERWLSGNIKTFTIRALSGYNTYTIDMNGVRGWTGTLSSLALAPALRATSGTFGIDWIRIGS